MEANRCSPNQGVAASCCQRSLRTKATAVYPSSCGSLIRRLEARLSLILEMKHPNKLCLGFLVVMIVLTLVSSISTLFLDERSDLQRLQKLQSQVSEMEESLERIPTEVSEDLGIRTELIEMHEQINRLIAKEKKKTRSTWWRHTTPFTFLFALILYYRSYRTIKLGTDERTSIP